MGLLGLRLLVFLELHHASGFFHRSRSVLGIAAQRFFFVTTLRLLELAQLESIPLVVLVLLVCFQGTLEILGLYLLSSFRNS